MENSYLEDIFKDFKVDGKAIPVAYMMYSGKEETYITYQGIEETPSFSSDDEVQMQCNHIDIDIYSKGNYIKIVKAVKKIMIENEYDWTGNSADQYEDDTGYYHKTLEFSKERVID